MMKNEKLLEWSNLSAEEVLEKAGISEIPFNPFTVADKIGIKVKQNIDWDKMGHDGEIYLNEKGVPEIWINPTASDNRQTFTLAHELGHLVNDVLPNIDKFKDPIYDDYTTLKRNGARNIKETRANMFASSLLMPFDALREVGQYIIDKYKRDNNVMISDNKIIEILSKRFEVSYDAMKWRLVNLKAIRP